MAWPRLPAMPLIEETDTIRPRARSTPSSTSIVVDALLGDQVDVQHHVPLVLGHPPERAVARDAGVVDDDVDAAVALAQVGGELVRRVLVGDVEQQRGAAELVDQLGEVVALRGDVDADDVGAVARQHAGDGGADAARGAGDHRDLAGQRLVPVHRVADSPAPIRITWPET